MIWFFPLGKCTNIINTSSGADVSVIHCISSFPLVIKQLWSSRGTLFIIASKHNLHNFVWQFTLLLCCFKAFQQGESASHACFSTVNVISHFINGNVFDVSIFHPLQRTCKACKAPLCLTLTQVKKKLRFDFTHQYQRLYFTSSCKSTCCITACKYVKFQ